MKATVTRCICCDQPFVRALRLAREHGCRNVAELKEHMTISTNCRLCVPYLQCVIETGETGIQLLEGSESEYWIGRSGMNGGKAEA